ncbi:MAG: NVEALA domain-containing protein [Tannerella sp.]|nr:NVEALA domain-containing protein [Tannerella sp.]
MKKILFATFAVAVIAVAAGLNVMQSRSEIALSDVALENVEALADDECFSAIPGRCGSNCPYEWCGYCQGFYLQECIP